jgi:glycosyltransferase involved in cell wall biosynthesis
MSDPADHAYRDLQVALVHYWFVTWRGGEKVVEAILKLFPRADVYTLFLDPEMGRERLRGHEVHTSFLDLPLARRHHRKLLPLYPRAVRSLRLRKRYDLVISSESGPAKGIPNPDRIPHLCYVHSPMRYCYGFTEPYLKTLPGPLRPLARRLLGRVRTWDQSTVADVGLYVANSRNVAERVRRYYRREARVCYPPIAAELFVAPPARKAPKHWVTFGALAPYKNVGLVVETFNHSGRPLVVIGDGSEGRRLQRSAAPNVRFTGNLPWPEVRPLLEESNALVFPGEEDFGMVPLEAMALGVPVVAFGRGGALETVVENPGAPERSSGVFFHEPTPESLQEALGRLEAIRDRLDPQWMQDHARVFGEDRFRECFLGAVSELLGGG